MMFKLIRSFAVPSLIFAAILMISCQRKQMDETWGGKDQGVLPDQESWNSEIYLTTGGVKNAVVKAGHIAKYNRKRLIQMDQGVKVDFYDKYERHTSVLTSDSGEVDERNNDLIAIGNVVVVSDSGITLTTERLKWDNRRAEILTDEFVTIATEKDTLYGYGFVSDASLKNWKIREPSGVTERKFD
ncbi:MAG: LPS export ABC transporter periplasmic protein LptC [Fidelibacterota bacterium]